MVHILLAVAVLGSFADGSDKPIDRTLAPLLAAHNRERRQGKARAAQALGQTVQGRRGARS